MKKLESLTFKELRNLFKRHAKREGWSPTKTVNYKTSKMRKPELIALLRELKGEAADPELEVKLYRMTERFGECVLYNTFNSLTADACVMEFAKLTGMTSLVLAEDALTKRLMERE